MTGAAGGLSGGLWAAYDARLVPGAPYVLDAIGFDALMRGSAFVVTGEGGLDDQTLQGKIVGEVATRCRQAGVTCHAIVGRNELDPFSERIIDLASVTEPQRSPKSRPRPARWCRGQTHRTAPVRDAAARGLTPTRRRYDGVRPIERPSSRCRSQGSDPSPQPGV